MEKMFFETMSGAEICKIRDADKLRLRTKGKYIFEEIRNAILKKDKYPFVKVVHYRLPNTFREYMIAVVVMDKAQAKKSDPWFLYHPLMRTATGICLYSTMRGETIVDKYTPHFFDRYAERMSEEIEGISTMNRIEVIRTFLKRNTIRPLKGSTKIRKGSREYEFFCNDGCIMVHPNDEKNIRVAKTFVPNRMFYDAQNERKDENKTPNKTDILLMNELEDRGLLFKHEGD